jgi:hypothetical protein
MNCPKLKFCEGLHGIVAHCGLKFEPLSCCAASTFQVISYLPWYCGSQRPRMLQIVFLVSLESSWRGWVHGLGSMSFFGLGSAKVLEYWMISSLKIKLNCSWNFLRNWNVPLVLLERSWWAGFNAIYSVRFGFRMWEIMIRKWYLPLKIQINSWKSGFGRKNQLRTW